MRGAGGARGLRLRFFRGVAVDASRLEEADQRVHVRLAEAKVRHPHLLVFLEETQGEAVARGQHLVRSRDVAGEPGLVPDLGDADEVGPEAVAVADGVARGASGPEQVLPLPAMPSSTERACVSLLPALWSCHEESQSRTMMAINRGSAVAASRIH